MKRQLVIIVLIFSFSLGFSQTNDSLSAEEKALREKNIQAGNPFKKFGYKPKIATLSKGKYLEFHDLDSIVKIGSFSYHVKKKHITGYTRIDPNNSEAGLSPEVISRWLSPDPLAEEFPSWSPYNFVENNPINMIDPTGLAPEHIIVDKNGNIVGGEMDDDLNIYRGKQDENGKWIKTDEVVGQLGNKYQGFLYNEKGGFEGYAEGARLITGKVQGFDNGQQYLESLNNQFNSDIKDFKGYFAALSYLAVTSRGTSGLGPKWLQGILGTEGFGKYDIKHSVFGADVNKLRAYDLYEYSDGTFMTPRSMGNMLFGANARSIFNTKVNAINKDKYDSKWFYSFFMQRAGSYNKKANNTQGTGGWPYYGEHEGSASSIYQGYFKGL